MPIKLSKFKITGTIAAGVFTSYSKPIRGKIVAVEIDYPASTVALTLTNEKNIAQTILNLGAANTDVWHYPRTYKQDEAGADLTFDGTRLIPTEFIAMSRLKLVAASGTNTQVVTMWVYVEEY